MVAIIYYFRVAHKDFFTFANLAKDFWFTFAKLDLPSPNFWKLQNHLRDFPCIDYDFSTKRDQYISQGLTTTDSLWSRGGYLRVFLQLCPYQMSLVRLCCGITYVNILRRDQNFLMKFITKYITRVSKFCLSVFGERRIHNYFIKNHRLKYQKQTIINFTG